MRKLILIIFVVAVFAASGYYLARNKNSGDGMAADAGYARIVSLSPSLTDSLFALGLGDKVVGVTQYCIYPPEAQTRAIVGNLYDHNYELIVRLKPDIVVMNADQARAVEHFKSLGLQTAVFENGSIEGVFDTFTRLGAIFNRNDEARFIVAEMRRRLEQYSQLTANLPKVRAMVCVGRSMGTASVSEAYVAGPQTYVGRLLEMAGGENVYDGQAPYPVLTAEGLIRLNPDVVIELVPEVGQGKISAREVVAQWRTLNEIAAVRNNRVHVLTQGYVVLPGPKLVYLLEDIMRVLYPALEI